MKLEYLMLLGFIILKVTLIRATVWTLIHDAVQNNIAGIPIVHQVIYFY